MKLYSQSSFYNPLMIETSGKGREIARIFIFDNNGEIIAQTGGWFTPAGYGSNSSHKEVIFDYDKKVKNKRTVDFSKEKVFTVNTTYDYASSSSNCVDLYIHNDVAKFELDRYIINFNRVDAVYKNHLGIEMTKGKERLDKNSAKIQTKIYEVQRDMNSYSYDLDKYSQLCTKFKKLYNQKKKALLEEKELVTAMKIKYNIK